MQYSRTALLTHSKCNSSHLLTTNLQYIPLPPSPMLLFLFPLMPWPFFSSFFGCFMAYVGPEPGIRSEHRYTGYDRAVLMCWAGDQTCILMFQRWCWSHCTTVETFTFYYEGHFPQNEKKILLGFLSETTYKSQRSFFLAIFILPTNNYSIPCFLFMSNFMTFNKTLGTLWNLLQKRYFFNFIIGSCQFECWSYIE